MCMRAAARFRARPARAPRSGSPPGAHVLVYIVAYARRRSGWSRTSRLRLWEAARGFAGHASTGARTRSASGVRTGGSRVAGAARRRWRPGRIGGDAGRGGVVTHET